MVYLEFLRARRAFISYAVILTLIVLASLIAGSFGNHADVTFQNDSGRSMHMHGLSSLGVVPVPVAAMLAIAGLGAFVIASALGGSFNRETGYAHFTFARPLSRMRMALLMASVDIGAIAVAGIFATILAFVAVSGTLGGHAHYVWDWDVLTMAALAFGAACMWYAILQAVSAWMPTRPSALIAAAWVLLLITIPLAHASWLGPLQYIFVLLQYVDPLAYFGGAVIIDGTSTGQSTIGAAASLRTVVTWLLACVGMAIAIVGWKRVEV